MPLFQEPQYLVTGVKTGAYTAQVGELVLVDTTLGDVTITAPVNPENGDPFAVKKISDDNNFVFVDGGVPDIETPLDLEIVSGIAVLFGTGANAEWIYDDGLNLWLNLTANKIPPYVELWSGADIITLTGTQNIVFTFVPLFTGQTAQLLTHSAGVFTEQITGSFVLNVASLITYNALANNVDAEISIGFSVEPEISALRFYNSFSTPRIGTFRNTAQAEGILSAVVGQTFSVNAIEEFATGNINEDITGTLLSVSI